MYVQVLTAQLVYLCLPACPTYVHVVHDYMIEHSTRREERREGGKQKIKTLRIQNFYFGFFKRKI